jgi:hypothetical protein
MGTVFAPNVSPGEDFRRPPGADGGNLQGNNAPAVGGAWHMPC